MKERHIGSQFKLNDNWFESYRINKVSDTRFYYLKELDGIHLTSTFAGNQLRRVFTQQFHKQTVVSEIDQRSGSEGEEYDDDEDV